MNGSFLLNLIIGLFAGVLSGMFGIGGGVVIVPALIVFSNLTIIQANGTSLTALLLPVAIFAVISYYRAGLINVKASASVALGLLLGVFFGSYFALSMPTSELKILYGIFMMYVSWNFTRPDEMWKKYVLKRKIVVKESLPLVTSETNKFLFLLGVGIFAGILSGMFGIGGGLVIVPVLIAFMKFRTKKAVGTSLGALLLPVGLPGVLLYYKMGDLNLGDAFPVAIGLAIGAIFGAKITISLPSAIVKRTYGVFLLIMGCVFIYRELFR